MQEFVDLASIDESKAHHLLFYLTHPFDMSEMDVDTSRGFAMCSVRAQRVVNRLNEVFGFNGWALEPEYERLDHGVLCKGKLYVKYREKPIYNTGYADFKTRDGKLKAGAIGDAYKSAQTDCLSKCASWIGIGNSVYSGEVCPYHVMASKKSEQFLKLYFKAKDKYPGGFLKVSIEKTEKELGNAKGPKRFDWWTPKDMEKLLTIWSK